MRKRQLIPLLFGIGFLVIERGFAWSSVMLSMAWVITLWCLGGVCIVAALVLILTSKRGGQTMSSKEEKEQRDIHVTSYGQQGGITAYQVNIQPGDRRLSDQAAEQLENYLNGVDFKSVEVNAVMGDGEAFRFASQIKNFLTSKGFDVKGVNQVVYSAPMQGQIIESPNDAGIVKVIIGNR